MAGSQKSPAKTPSKTPVKAQKPVKSSGVLGELGGVSFNLAIVALAVAVYAANQNPAFLAKLPPAAPNKPYATFDDFFPFYLKEHSNSINRGLHFIGTSLATVVAVWYPMSIAAVLVSGASQPLVC
jgi:hypothetical protein